MEDHELTTNTVSAIIFNEVGYLVNASEFEEADIDRLGNVMLPYEMGLYNLETYEKFIRETISEILMRIKVIDKPLLEKDVQNHRTMSKILIN